jgi:membrane fusion protein (multidrug efflux system)
MNKNLLMISSILSGCFLLLSCGEKRKPAPNPANIAVPVNIVRLKMEKPVYYDKFPGTVVALMQVDIHPEVEGYVTGMFFKEGDKVKKGQKLYSIDDSKYRASVNQASANVSVAESNLDQAQKDADRYNALNEHNAVAKQMLDHAVTTLQNAKNQVTASKQELLRAQTDLGYSIITAPFDGTIGISQVKLGNTVTTGQTILNTISTDDPMAADIIVNEKQISRFLKLEQHKPNEADSIFTLGLPDNSIYNKIGQISFIDRGVNPETGSITVRIEFPNPDFELRAGMSCTVRVRNDDTSRKVLIPSKAIVEQMGEYFVYIAKDTVMNNSDPSNKNNPSPGGPSLRALQRKIVLGQTIANRVIIKSGLEAGADLIVDGVQKLHDGSLVTTGNPGEKKSSGK